MYVLHEVVIDVSRTGRTYPKIYHLDRKIQTGEFFLIRKRLYILHKYVIYNLLWLWLEIKLTCLINPFYFKYRETSDQPSKTISALVFYGGTELELNHDLARMIQSN